MKAAMCSTLRRNQPRSFAASFGWKVRMYISMSQKTPTATWQPCVPVRVKKVVPRMLLFVIVRCFS